MGKTCGNCKWFEGGCQNPFSYYVREVFPCIFPPLEVEATDTACQHWEEKV